ncbi:hypothetical protein ACWEO2_14205 [Nocardia sp. NPDC004278]
MATRAIGPIRPDSARRDTGRPRNSGGRCYVCGPYFVYGVVAARSTGRRCFRARLRSGTARRAEIVDAIGAHISGHKPYTFLTPEETAAAAFDESTLARLREIKRARDPRSVIRSNYPVLG